MAENRRRVSDENIERMIALHAEGRSYREIGQTLKVSHTTVRAYVVFGSTNEFNRSVAESNGYDSVNGYQSARIKARGFNTQHEYRKALEEKRNSRESSL